MLRKLYLTLILLVSLFKVQAFEAAFSHAVYYLPDPVYAGKINPYLEAYWQVNPAKLHYNTNAEKKIIARILTEVTIINDTGHILKKDHYVYETKPADSVAQLAYLNILELKRYFLTAGNFKLRVKLTDMNDTTNSIVYNDTFSVGKTNASVFYGDLKFVDTFYNSEIRTPFRKHGKQYIPWCESFFDSYKNTLNYYTELYQLNKVDSIDFPLIQSVFISKREGQEPFSTFIKLDTINTRETAYYDGSFNIRNLPSGNYYLNISLGTKLHTTLASRSIFFQRMNTNKITAEMVAQKAALDTSLENVNVLDLTKTFVKKYDLPQVTAILKMLLPVTDQAGARAIEGFLKKPDEMYMRYFVYNYFLAKDKVKPEKAWKEYSEKVKEANRLYTSHGKPGYETERGFYFLRYGAPSEVVTVINEKGSLPYEIWQYNNLVEMSGRSVGNAVILFYKTSESDLDFRLLHTTISGESHNSGWRNFLYTNSDGGTNLNSRAEQYIGSR